MRLAVWAVVVVVAGYAAYAGMMSAWQWFEVESVVDEALEPRNATDVITIRNNIVRNANDAGVPLTAGDVVVTASARTMLVTIVWAYPVIHLNGETVLAVPLSVKRTKEGAIAAR